VHPAVHDGALVVPRTEDRLDGLRQLLARVAGEVAAGLAFDDRLEGSDQRGKLLGGDLRVGDGAFQLFGVEARAVDAPDRGHAAARLFERALERLFRHAEGDARVHRDEAAVGVEGEPRVLRLRGEPFGDRVV
jgi:hypothetical protein